MLLQKKLAIALTCLLLVACGHDEAPTNAPMVVVQQPQMEKLAKTSSYAGTVTTVEMVDLLPRIQGYLKEIPFEQGQMVHTGDVLFVIEPDQYQAVVMQKQAALSAAKATLAERSLNVERMRTLYEKKVVSAANKDQAESDFYNAQANVQAAEAALKNAELDLSYTQISAPITGRIGITKFSVGDYLSPNSSTLATIVQLDPIRVVFSIPEQEWLSIEALEQKAPGDLKDYLTPLIKLSNGVMYDAPGRISFVDNHIDPNTGSLAVYATFANPKAILLPGQFVTVIIEQGEAHDVLTVPTGAVLYDTAGHYLLLVNADQHVEKRYVKTGIAHNNRTEITEGLTLNDTFITEGLQKVIPGMPVTTTTKPV